MALEHGISQGIIERDADMDNIKNTTEFIELMKKYKRK